MNFTCACIPVNVWHSVTTHTELEVAGVDIDDDNGHGSDLMAGAEDIEQECDEPDSEGSAGDAVGDEDEDNEMDFEGDGDDGTASEVSTKMPDITV
jgi:hypothetical protein